MTAIQAIEIQGLCKKYGSFEALKGIDFEVHAGEIFGFLGPNGAGKSTTIRSVSSAPTAPENPQQSAFFSTRSAPPLAPPAYSGLTPTTTLWRSIVDLAICPAT